MVLITTIGLKAVAWVEHTLKSSKGTDLISVVVLWDSQSGVRIPDGSVVIVDTGVHPICTLEEIGLAAMDGQLRLADAA